MAKGKKTFIFYTDWTNMIQQMPDIDAGKLLKHILLYVNDKEPKSDSVLVNLVFSHIKPLLKEDLEKWESIRKKRVKSGRKGGKAKSKQMLANASKCKQSEAVNVNVNDNVNDNDNNKKKTIKKESQFLSNDESIEFEKNLNSLMSMTQEKIYEYKSAYAHMIQTFTKYVKNYECLDPDDLESLKWIDKKLAKYMKTITGRYPNFQSKAIFWKKACLFIESDNFYRNRSLTQIKISLNEILDKMTEQTGNETESSHVKEKEKLKNPEHLQKMKEVYDKINSL
jgi:hypothetical protein